MTVIEAKGLSKHFHSYKKQPGLIGSVKQLVKRDYTVFKAIDAIDLSIEAGKIIGLLGPNGAGKTTLMKCFTGIIIPSSGQLSVNGYTPSERHIQFRKDLSLVMGQKSQLWWDIPALDSLELIQHYYEISNNEFQKRLNHLCDALDTQHLLHTPIRKMSLGERMKMELTACLLHNPKLIFLDEPTIGLDIMSQQKIRQFLKDYHSYYKPTIIMSSHYMQDIESLCDHIILILNGKKVFDDRKTKFKKVFSDSKSLLLTYINPLTSNEKSDIQSFVESVSFTDKTASITVSKDNYHEVVSKLSKNKNVDTISTTKQDLEHIFTQYIQKTKSN